MTKKHFKKLADALKRVKPASAAGVTAGLAVEYGQWAYCVRSVADICAFDNRRFDRDRFYEACGYDPMFVPPAAA